MSGTLSVLAIIISLALLIYLGYKNWSVILIAPILALLAAGLTGLATGGDLHLLATYTEVFMTNLAGYVKSYFPFFLLGAIFGKLMEVSGSAKSIAYFIVEKAGAGKEVLAVVLACSVITYGGVSLFVAAFAIYPIGVALFKKSNLPKRLLPPSIALGAFTFTMTAIPGTPQVQNTIPMQYFGTDAFAAPILGLVAAAIMLFGGLFWIETRMKKALAAGEGYGEHPNENVTDVHESNLPSFGIAMAPIVVVIALNFILSKFVFANMNAAYLEKDFATTLSAVSGAWSLILGLVAGIILCIALNHKRFEKGVAETLKDGVAGSFLAVMNTASEVGYGNVIKTLAGYGIVATALLGISANPLIGGAISTSVLAGITGSASGGMSIALASFGDTFLKAAHAMNISPEALHRVIAVASGGLDTLPHNGAVITLLAITGLRHKDCYVNVAMCTLVIPLISCAAIIVLGSMGIA